MKQVRISSNQPLIKRCDECRKHFDLNDGGNHYYDAQADIYLCSDRCLYDSFFENLRDTSIDYILRNPEYNVVKFGRKRAVIA